MEDLSLKIKKEKKKQDSIKNTFRYYFISSLKFHVRMINNLLLVFLLFFYLFLQHECIEPLISFNCCYNELPNNVDLKGAQMHYFTIST